MRQYAAAAFWAMVTVGRVLFAALGRWLPARATYRIAAGRSLEAITKPLTSTDQATLVAPASPAAAA